MLSVNYFSASSLGVLAHLSNDTFFVPINAPVYFWGTAILIGTLFLLMFLLLQQTIKKVGLSISSSAAKLSVIVPVLVSLVIDPGDILSSRKVFGIITTLMALILILYKKKSAKLIPTLSSIYYPILLFMGMGLVDSLVKIAQHKFVPNNTVSFFSFSVFLISGVLGCIFLTLRGEGRFFFQKKELFFGLILGVVNFGSLYFIINALNLNLNGQAFLDSSRIFMFNNLGIIVLSVLVGVLFFREKLSFINIIGVCAAVAAICLLV